MKDNNVRQTSRKLTANILRILLKTSHFSFAVFPPDYFCHHTKEMKMFVHVRGVKQWRQ